jgi:hypothetical protein
VTQFPGTVLYAIKCNPHPLVLKALYKGGIRHFVVDHSSELDKVLKETGEHRCISLKSSLTKPMNANFLGGSSPLRRRLRPPCDQLRMLRVACTALGGQLSQGWR